MFILASIEDILVIIDPLRSLSSNFTSFQQIIIKFDKLYIFARLNYVKNNTRFPEKKSGMLWLYKLLKR